MISGGILEMQGLAWSGAAKTRFMVGAASSKGSEDTMDNRQ